MTLDAVRKGTLMRFGIVKLMSRVTIEIYVNGMNIAKALLFLKVNRFIAIVPSSS